MSKKEFAHINIYKCCIFHLKVCFQVLLRMLILSLSAAECLDLKSRMVSKSNCSHDTIRNTNVLKYKSDYALNINSETWSRMLKWLHYNLICEISLNNNPGLYKKSVCIYNSLAVLIEEHEETYKNRIINL